MGLASLLPPFLSLNTIWFLLVGILFTGYAILDGFDLGVGILHLFSKDEHERRTFLNAIGPVWDGNEVWLVTGGGALFAAFPDVYASVFSGFYLAFYLLLVCLIFRAVAIEFRSKVHYPWWPKVWDISFSVSSLLAALLIGTAIGNIAIGVPVQANKEITISLLGLLTPYPLLIGISTVLLFAMHGNIYLIMKTEEALQQRLLGWIKHTVALAVTAIVISTMATLIYVPHMSERLKQYPILMLLALGLAFAIANVPRALSAKGYGQAFISSCFGMVFLMALFGLGLYPNLVISSLNPAWSLTIFNAVSSQKTLEIMLIIALLGVPLVLTYTASIYWVFRGKVKKEDWIY